MVINLYPSVLIRKTRDTVDKNRGATYLCHLNVTHHRLECPTRTAVAVSCMLLMHFIDSVCLRWIFLFAELSLLNLKLC